MTLVSLMRRMGSGRGVGAVVGIDGLMVMSSFRSPLFFLFVDREDKRNRAAYGACQP